MHNARPARGPGVAVGHVGRALLVAAQNGAQVGLVQLIVQGQHGPAGNAEDELDVLGLKALHQCPGTRHAGRRRLLAAARHCQFDGGHQNPLLLL